MFVTNRNISYSSELLNFLNMHSLLSFEFEHDFIRSMFLINCHLHLCNSLNTCSNIMKLENRWIYLLIVSSSHFPFTDVFQIPCERHFLQSYRFDRRTYLPLKLKDANSPCIMLFRFTGLDPKKVNIHDSFKLYTMLHDILLLENDNYVVKGFMAIQDFQDATMTHMLMMTPTLAKKVATIFQEAYPTRPKGFHYINTASFFENVFNMFKALMKEKLQRRVSFTIFQKACNTCCFYLCRWLCILVTTTKKCMMLFLNLLCRKNMEETVELCRNWQVKQRTFKIPCNENNLLQIIGKRELKVTKTGSLKTPSIWPTRRRDRESQSRPTSCSELRVHSESWTLIDQLIEDIIFQKQKHVLNFIRGVFVPPNRNKNFIYWILFSSILLKRAIHTHLIGKRFLILLWHSRWFSKILHIYPSN